MKKAMLTIIAILAVTGGAAGCSTPDTGREAKAPESTAASEQNVEAETKSNAKEQSGRITEEEAKKIALDHAGIKAEDATFLKAALDIDDGKEIYEVEFYSGSSQYDYDIDAASGEVLSYDYDAESQNNQAGNNATKDDIGEKKAKEIALAKVKGAGDADIRIKQEYDDGRLIYEGTIVYQDMEYEFEIDAADGHVIEWSSESVFDD